MKRLLSPALLLLVTSACLSIPGVEQVEPEPGTPDGGDVGTGIPDSGSPGRDAGHVEALEARFISPEAVTHARGTVRIQVEVRGAPTAVELLVDEGAGVPLQAPYTWEWDTTQVPERPHRIKVRVTKGAQVAESDERMVVVDRTAPTVTARTPEPQEKNVSVRRPITLSFSERVLEQSVTPETLKLLVNQVEQEATRTLSPDGMTLTVSPTSTLSVPSVASVETTSGITDLAGNALILPQEVWSWELPSLRVESILDLSNKAAPIPSAALALDSVGNPILAHAKNYAFNVEHWSGSAWSPMGQVPIFQGPGGPLSYPTIKRISDGTTFTAIAQNGGRIVSVYRQVSSVWFPIGSELAITPGYPPPYSLSVTEDQQLGIALSVAGSPNQLEVRRWNESAWDLIGAPIDVSVTDNQFRAHTPSLYVDKNNKHLVAWVEGYTSSDLGDIRVRRWNGTTWVALGDKLNDLPSPGRSQKGTSPSVQLDKDGLPLVAWVGVIPPGAVNSQVYGVYVHRWNGFFWEQLGEALRWDKPSTSRSDRIYYPTLKTGQSGRIFVAWSESASFEAVYSTVICLRYWDGTRWVPLSDTSTMPYYFRHDFQMELDHQERPVVSGHFTHHETYINFAVISRHNH